MKLIILWLIIFAWVFTPTIMNYKKFGFPPAWVWFPWSIMVTIFVLTFKLMFLI